jgi:hypothetical protein
LWRRFQIGQGDNLSVLAAVIQQLYSKKKTHSSPPCLKITSDNEGKLPHIIILGTRWRRIVSFTLRQPYSQRRPQQQLDKILGDRVGVGVVVLNKSLSLLEIYPG